MSRLSLLAIVLGLGMGLTQLYGLKRPAAYAGALRRFPRSTRLGVVLMLLGTIWFLWNLGQESIADFAIYKNVLYVLFAAVGVGACIFVQDLLAVRGLAVVLLLLAKLMVDTGRPHLPDTAWVWVVQTSAYVLVVLGIWLTVSPWRLRDWLNWLVGTEHRLKVSCGVGLAFGLCLVVLGVFKF